ncbi:hypothetical protein KR51_00027460 [Rubidibacter lacunae KORDI 51-2]|uniref:Uncharacterized protein n=1 Tax=Rubidibacter lacunae KORDI 51-2 TaxID=582515 RepID=U5DIJ1_9CHRO|nr:hypothetical protein [Rubidibacter lacunae]ERN40757.1 hypothetical protein KR51_00027460 [Rubidibacter lacunae KORDI 51-2]
MLKSIAAIAGSALAVSLSLAGAPAVGEPVMSNSMLLAARFDGANFDGGRCTIVKVEKASILPGYMVVVARSHNETYELFYTESPSAVIPGERYYCSFEAVYSDETGTDVVAITYEEANALYLASREALYAELWSTSPTVETFEPTPTVVEPAPAAAPEPVRALW